VIAAGSLLDSAVEKVGMPVGRVSPLYIYPLSFIEFLAALNRSSLIEAILFGKPLSEVNHVQLIDLLMHYLIIGGMPEVVATWISTKQEKYVEVLFNQIPHFIGEQFKYSSIHGEFKKRELSPCLDLLRHANVIHAIRHSAGNGIPLGAEINLEWFKLIFKFFSMWAFLKPSWGSTCLPGF
jgi:predicted AAA+ superfamily ATPase